jgi:two-component system chemotaxis response regulator CheY
MRCLIVDDEIICRKKVHCILHEVAHCDEAANGSDAVARFTKALQRQEPYDVVILDILMPDIDGHDTAVKIREVEKELATDAGVKIIMLTVLDSVNDAMRSFAYAQATAYMVKPVSEEKLIGAFKELGIL